ncbi:hypothetical protein P4S72_00880 [Vibrio sp. PP-XX7]
METIPGITAANACASLVGAPLGHDSCTISLSDLLTHLGRDCEAYRSCCRGGFCHYFL